MGSTEKKPWLRMKKFRYSDEIHYEMTRRRPPYNVATKAPKNLTELLATPEWKGSEVVHALTNPPSVRVIHPSGAEVRIYFKKPKKRWRL